jgi:hypothetical protein
MMRAVRVVLLIALAAGCGFDHGMIPGDSGDAPGPGSDTGSGSDTGGNGVCPWSYTPTNFDPCALPSPAELHVTADTTLDTQTTTLPKLSRMQSDSSPLTVIHLTTLAIDAGTTLTLQGTAVVLAVDGNADVAGTIVVAAGNDDPNQCDAAMRGSPGQDSMNQNGGGGGGGGGAGDGDGGDGGDGAGTMAGSKGAKGKKNNSTLSPLRGGCRGGAGGRNNAAGSGAEPGRGGGGLQIATNATLTITGTGFIDAAGRGGSGGIARVGGGGGGAGGGIFLEGPTVLVMAAAHLCADGGSGGEGGGDTAIGNNGRTSPCSGAAGATTIFQGTYGGAAGGGGYYVTPSGGNALSSSGFDGGGGGGGGGVGWIRLKSPGASNTGIVTPAPVTN